MNKIKFSDKLISKNRASLKEKSVFEISANTNIIERDFRCSIDNKNSLNDFQGYSGYCWIYAGVAMLKDYLKSKYKIGNYEFSYAYLQFYDKYEKMKYAVDIIFDKKYDKDYFANDLTFLTSDKGNFEIFCSLINKYGIVPKRDMPDTYCVKKTFDINYVLHNYLINLINKIEKNEKMSKEKVLKDVHELLGDCYGVPPTIVKVNLSMEEVISPNEFYDKYLDRCLDEYVTISNYRDDEEYVNKSCCYKNRYNFISRKKTTVINFNKNFFKKVIINQLKNNATYISMKIVDGDLKKGIFDDKLYKLNDTLGLDVELDKTSFMKFKEGVSEHALMLVGVDIQNNKVIKWKVRDNNANVGESGYCIISNDWFDKYVCSVVVNKKTLNKNILNNINEEPINLF